jgi:prefoldin subunit 5
MSDQPLNQQIVELRSRLSTIDSQLTKAGNAPEGLEDLKHAVDNLRNNVWAILSASRSSNYHVNVERFRLRRAIEIAKGLIGAIDAGTMKTLHPEHSEMQIVLQQLNERIGRLRQGA